MPPRAFRVQRRHRHLRYALAEVRAFLRSVESCLPGTLPPGAISVVFLHDAEMARIHADFFGDPSPTDVMTFPLGEEDLCGEVFVAPDFALAQSLRFKTSLEWEIGLYLIHGLLHLSGFEDGDEETQAAMRQAESAVFETAGVRKYWPRFWLEKC